MSAAWRVAARFPALEAAAAARSALDLAGIETYLDDENGDLRVMVRDADLEQAGAVLRGLKPPDPPAEAERCRECGSAELQPVARLRILLLLSVVMAGIGVAVGQPLFGAICLLAVVAGVALMPSHRCLRCGWTSTPIGELSRRLPQFPIRVDLIEKPCPHCGTINVRALRRCEACGSRVR